MNGFTNTILTLLLSWLKALFNSLWRLFTSESGGSIYSFLSNHWKTIFLILCVGGFVLDRVVYFIRWRPYYVWSSRLHRLHRLRGARGDTADTQAPAYASKPETPAPQPAMEPPERPAYADASTQTAVYQPAQAFYAPITSVQPQASTFAPPAEVDAAAPFLGTQIQKQGVQPIFVEHAPAFVPHAEHPDDYAQATVHYAPIAQSIPKEHVPYHQPYVPPHDLEPVFDEELGSWEQSAALVRPLAQSAYRDPAEGMTRTFGSSKPEPVDYIRDMQAGFAPMLPPEQLYAPLRAAQPTMEPLVAPSQSGPIHPGLDSNAFRHSFGLSPAKSLSMGEMEADEPAMQAAAHVPTFMPYAPGQGTAAVQQRRNPFAGFAKKARSLVGVENEDHRATIHDLQPTVDMRTAFHEPVYPKQNENESSDL
ncbi:MAG: hypothetical protein RSB91_01465 [Clostridia bacterium]